MNICVDISAMLQQSAGIARYVREMLPRLRRLASGDQISLFFNNSRRVTLPPQHADLARYSVALTNKTWRLRVAADYLRRSDMDACFPGIDLFFATDHLLPRLRRTRCVINIRDLSYLLQPAFHNRLSRIYQQALMPRFAEHADRIIVPSEVTRRDLLRCYGLAGDKLSVVPEGVDERYREAIRPHERARVRARHALPGRYLLYVGTLEPRKNIVGLLEAYAALLRRGLADDLTLVLAGKPGWRYAPTLRRIGKLGIEARVRRLGFVAEEDLPALYAEASAFVFPSFYEGFGLPPLEAMACGTPVIASNTASLPEVVGEAGLLIDPHDTRQLTAALEALLADEHLAARLRAAGPQQAAPFTWERTAERTLALLREAYKLRA